MTDTRPMDPFLLCAGTDPAAAARLAEAAASLLADRPAVVVATWHTPPMSGLETVMDALYDSELDLRSAAREAAAEAVAAASAALSAHGIAVSRTVCAEEEPPWRIVLDLAGETGASVIVAGTAQAAGAQPGALGREARALAHRSERPLLFIPPGAAPADRVAPAIFADDGSAPAAHATQAASGLLRPRPAIVATAWETTSYAVGVALLAVPARVAQTSADRLDELARAHAEETAAAAGAQLAGAGWSCDSVALEARHNAAGAILAAAREHDAAAIVTGTRGRSRIAAALLGSTAETLLRHAGRPVLLVPPRRAGV